jgi:hypothetical protein
MNHGQPLGHPAFRDQCADLAASVDNDHTNMPLIAWTRQ